jgi:hypothetical protein
MEELSGICGVQFQDHEQALVLKRIRLIAARGRRPGADSLPRILSH